MLGRFARPFEPPFEELSARSQGFSPGYEPSAAYALRVKPGYPTPLTHGLQSLLSNFSLANNQ
jgi:hypothetical protein